MRLDCNDDPTTDPELLLTKFTPSFCEDIESLVRNEQNWSRTNDNQEVALKGEVLSHVQPFPGIDRTRTVSFGAAFRKPYDQIVNFCTPLLHKLHFVSRATQAAIHAKLVGEDFADAIGKIIENVDGERILRGVPFLEVSRRQGRHFDSKLHIPF